MRSPIRFLLIFCYFLIFNTKLTLVLFIGLFKSIKING